MSLLMAPERACRRPEPAFMSLPDIYSRSASSVGSAFHQLLSFGATPGGDPIRSCRSLVKMTDRCDGLTSVGQAPSQVIVSLLASLLASLPATLAGPRACP